MNIFRKFIKDNNANQVDRVADYYNTNTNKFLEVYGEIIQAFRTTNVEDYLNYTIKSAELKNNQRIVDAGCGVCGPAIYFANTVPELFIEACTVSNVQAEMAQKKVIEKNLQNRIKVTLGDYHKLPELFSENSFDRVVFLESFGHSKNKKLAIESAWKVLKPGGKLYVKDLFVRESDNEWEQLRINHICDEINKAYEYEVGNLHEVISALRKIGFLINFIRPPQIDISQFEHLTISNDFQNLFNIGKIESWDEYIFPIDFFEILVEKPIFNLQENKHLYFMNKP
jgi:ubiquinone/menaquinone biosynthesis C-methylase UbiE